MIDRKNFINGVSVDIQNSFDIFRYLKELGYLKKLRDKLWWPKSRSFEVVVGAILTQQSKWERVEKSLENLKNEKILSLEGLGKIDVNILSTLIKPSGFYNIKAKRIKLLANNIQKDFGDFDSFKNEASRQWLLLQQGIAKESSDSILCYACEKECLPVDNYTVKLVKQFGYEFNEYDELKEWMEEGILSNLEKIYKIYGEKKSINEIFARFHGKIVEFGKDKIIT